MCQHLPGKTENNLPKASYKEPVTQLKFEAGILRIKSLESYRYNISFNSSPDRPILINIDGADGRDE